LRQLNHNAIIGLRDCDYADHQQTRPYIEMDYFPSQTLEDYVQQNGTLPERDVCDIARQIAQALRAAHARDVLHRDVKPANILLRRNDEDDAAPQAAWTVKLIDFGLALCNNRLKDSSSGRTIRGTSISGTIDYAAPEQMGKITAPVTFASDVYSFACTCYYALFKTPHPKSKHFDQLSPGFKKLLDDCSCDDPSERVKNFDEVLQRLEPAMAQRRSANTTSASSGSTLGQIGDKATSWFKQTFGTPAKKSTPPVARPKSDPVVALPRSSAGKPAKPPLADVVPIEEELPVVDPIAAKQTKEVLDVLPVDDCLEVVEFEETAPPPSETPNSNLPRK
jgi:serine/threonine protein kinase